MQFFTWKDEKGNVLLSASIRAIEEFLRKQTQFHIIKYSGNIFVQKAHLRPIDKGVFVQQKNFN